MAEAPNVEALQTIIRLLAQQAKPRPDIITPGSTGALENARPYTFAGRVGYANKPESVQELLKRMPMGDNEEGMGLATAGIEALKQFMPQLAAGAAQKLGPTLLAGMSKTFTPGPASSTGITSFKPIHPGESLGPFVAGENVSNLSSIRASLEPGYVVEKGIQAVPLSEFYGGNKPNLKTGRVSEIERTNKLAEAIRESKRLDPLIVVRDKEGSYVLEGGHRLDASYLLDATHVPAIVVREAGVPVRTQPEPVRTAKGKTFTPGPASSTSSGAARLARPGSIPATEYEHMYPALVDARTGEVIHAMRATGAGGHKDLYRQAESIKGFQPQRAFLDPKTFDVYTEAMLEELAAKRAMRSGVQAFR